MKANNNKNITQAGFTLIETLMAIAIFTIGILGLFGMQTAVIKQNLSANTITAGSTWATDQVEMLLGLPYLHPSFDVLVEDCTVFDDNELAIATARDNDKETDYHYVLQSRDIFDAPPFYTIYWNVSQSCIMNTIPNANAARDEQKPKYIQIIVQKEARNAPGAVEHQHGGDHVVAVFNYIKQNKRQD
jgi:prepilin-type N-terminal cleavage/methylation domain-containing protein